MVIAVALVLKSGAGNLGFRKTLEAELSKISVSSFGILLGGLTAGALLSFSQSTFASTIMNNVLWQGSVNVRVKIMEQPLVGVESNAIVTLENNSDRAINVVGGGKSCSCMTLNLHQRSIPPNGSLVLNVAFIQKKPGAFHHRVVYYLDSPRQHRAIANIISFSKDPL